MSLPIIPGPNNQLVTASAAPAYGSTANYNQYVADPKSISTSGTFPKSLASASITTYGNPVLIMACGDANPLANGVSGLVQLYRGSMSLCIPIKFQNAIGNVHIPYSVQCVDPVPAGSYTYYLNVTSLIGGACQFGDPSGPDIMVIELGSV